MTGSRLEFLRGRQPGLGGTDMPAILGLTPGKNALDIYHSKTRPIREEDAEETDSVDLLRGTNLEDQARAWYWKQTGRRGRDVRKATVHPDFPAFKCHLDFEVFADPSRPEGFQGTGVGETKCPRAWVLQKVADNGLRITELVQGITYCAVSRRDWVGFNLFSWEYDGGPVLPIDIQADTDLGQHILETGQRFWDEHVLPRVPPDPAEWQSLGEKVADAALDTAVRTSSGKLVKVTDEAFKAEALRLMDLQSLVKDASGQVDTLKAQLQAWIEAHSASDKVQVPGAGKLTVVRNGGRDTFSREALEGHRPIDRDKLYRWLADATPGQLDELTPAQVEQLLEDLELDLGQYVRKGDPFSYLLVTPEK